MDPALITGVFGLGRELIGRLIPDPEQRARAEKELEELEQTGELQRMNHRYSAITAEANSNDPWTSRARPSFLYVMYLMILSAIPMGVLHAFKPDLATAIAAGMKAWLGAIPGEMWALFGAGYLGYSYSRSQDKKNSMLSRISGR